jgi:hypothetical protein
MPKHEHLVLKFTPGYSRAYAPQGSPFHDADTFHNDVLLTPNADALLEDMEGEISRKQAEGWAVVSATDVLAGHCSPVYEAGYGFSTTAAIIVILRRELPA